MLELHLDKCVCHLNVHSVRAAEMKRENTHVQQLKQQSSAREGISFWHSGCILTRIKRCQRAVTSQTTQLVQIFYPLKVHTEESTISFRALVAVMVSFNIQNVYWITVWWYRAGFLRSHIVQHSLKHFLPIICVSILYYLCLHNFSESMH